MRILFLIGGSVALVWGQYAAPAASVGPDEAWRNLLEGNSRYLSGTGRHPNQSPAKRTELAKGQHPFAVILSCADSRVPPEVIFDQGLGDLFTVRVAGNVAPDDMVGSIEFAVANLGPKLIVVLGHERCGAVDAALKGGPAEGHLGVLLDRIKPAADAAKGQKDDPLDFAIRANVKNVVKQLESTGPIISGFVAKGTVKIVGARYDLDTGKVEVVQ